MEKASHLIDLSSSSPRRPARPITYELHTFKDFNKDAFSHQILLESKELPTSWKNLIIVKEFFKKFGEVIGARGSW